MNLGFTKSAFILWNLLELREFLVNLVMNFANVL